MRKKLLFLALVIAASLNSSVSQADPVCYGCTLEGDVFTCGVIPCP